ncbi:hypothetical protein D7Z26_26865 [Cohnella endophytica]|uniref:J domain-containing protein n=1 Tax=Cohnella endophytica TaxID=2419778 RepID=A0A494X8D9_9BACL|nr:hypothetical protein [Cohnella endophytica]RKP44289.1 hypothetical protein D7Z26_26865 [Cohnella endophytica]
MSELDEELKKAYEILGLPEDATREQVENRYFILMKKARSEKSRSEAGVDEQPGINLADYNRAYNLVLGIESEKIITVEKQTKFGHFVYYYKFHVIIGFIIVLLASYFIKEGIDKRREAANTPPANLSVSVFGNFYFADETLLQANMLKLIPDWKRIKTTVVFVPTEVKSQQDMALQQKSVLMLMTEKSELYITDETNFNGLAAQGAFVKLDDFMKSEPLQVPADKIVNAQSADDTEQHPYGIDITGNPIFKDVDMSGSPKIILAIRAKETKWPDTEKLLEQIVRTNP